MKFATLIILAAALAQLPGCAAPTASSLAAHAKASQPPPHPRGWVLAGPPADSSFYPLRCWNDGPETHCVRETGPH